MRRGAFERLVSEWLDQPDNVELRARVLAAIAADPRLAGVLCQWCRLETLIQRGLPAPPTRKASIERA